MDGALNTLPPDAPSPRLCHLRKRPDFNGYGFNLHAEKGKSGQFIGKVDPGSPAELAGLKEGDRIVEVNGTNVSNENHQQVVQRIKAVSDETKFLVVDKIADEYYHEKKIVVKGDMPNVVVKVTPLYENSTGTTDPKYSPRLCCLKIWPDFTGYGFNLHAEKGKVVQYIGKVDANSPADAAGLKENDRIVEVNGKNVASVSHQEVVKMIKSDPKEVKLLVVDRETDDYFQKQGLVPTNSMSCVKKIICPDTNPSLSAGKAHVPRLCHIKAKPDGKGYGFNMQAQKGKIGQFIGKVDPGSPAEAAGLRDGDVLIEVNGFNVENQSHKEVVEKIKSVPNETTLLVIDKQGYEACKADGVVVTSAMVMATTTAATTSSTKETTTTAAAAASETTTAAAGKTENGQAAQSEQDKISQKEEEEEEEEADEGEDEERHVVAAAGAAVVVTSSARDEDEYSENDEDKPNASDDVEDDDQTEKEEQPAGKANDSKKEEVIVIAAVQENDDKLEDKNGNVTVVVSETSKQEVKVTESTKKPVDEKNNDYEDVTNEMTAIAITAEKAETSNKVEATKVEVTSTKVEATSTKVEATSTKVEATSPKVEATSPKVETTSPKVEEQKPDKSALKLDVTSASANTTKTSTKTSTTSPSTTSISSSTSVESPKSPVVVGGIEFSGSAEEARRKMSKKRNVKDTNMSIKAKYDLFQKL